MFPAPGGAGAAAAPSGRRARCDACGPLRLVLRALRQRSTYDDLLAALTATTTERQALLRQFFEPSEVEREQNRKIPTPAHLTMVELIATRSWLTVYQLPAYAHELNPVEPVWSHLKRSLANLAKRGIGELTALVKTRLTRIQYGPASLRASSSAPGLTSHPWGLCRTRYQDR